MLNASGILGYGFEYAERYDIKVYGAFITKGTTSKPRDGNPQPRLIETDFGIINSIGLENPGIDRVLEFLPLWKEWEMPVILNLAGESPDEYIEVAEKIKGFDAVELNLSCPNIKGEFWEPALIEEITREVKGRLNIPVFVKLPPSESPLRLCEASLKGGADGITLTNTIKALAIDIWGRKPLIKGGLSGPALKPIALSNIYEVAKSFDIPIIGCGGITKAEDAIEFIMAGAWAFEIGTAILTDPHIPRKVIEGVERFMEREKIQSLEEIRGIALK